MINPMLSFLLRLIPAQEVHAHSGGHSKAANAARAAAKGGGGGGGSLDEKIAFHKKEESRLFDAQDRVMERGGSSPSAMRVRDAQHSNYQKLISENARKLRVLEDKKKSQTKATGKKVEANRNESFTSGATNKAGSKPVTVVKSSLSRTSSSEYGKKLTAKQRKEIERDITMEPFGLKPGKRTLTQETYKTLLLKEGYM